MFDSISLTDFKYLGRKDGVEYVECSVVHHSANENASVRIVKGVGLRFDIKSQNLFFIASGQHICDEYAIECFKTWYDDRSNLSQIDKHKAIYEEFLRA